MAKIRARKETGTLYFDFFYRGERCREQTALEDTSANRKRLQKALDRIEEEISYGTFDYARAFPGSKHAARFAAPVPAGLRVITGSQKRWSAINLLTISCKLPTCNGILVASGFGTWYILNIYFIGGAS